MTSVIKNFDMDAFRRQRAAKQAAGGVDLVEALKGISPEIETLKVGETAVVDIPGRNLTEKQAGLRKAVMSVTAKLSNLTCKGGKWEGRTYDTVSNPEKGVIYVQRGSNLKAEEIKERKRGGRKPKAETNASTETQDGATVTEHA